MLELFLDHPVNRWAHETITNLLQVILVVILVVVSLILSLLFFARLIYRRLHREMAHKLGVRHNLRYLLVDRGVGSAATDVAFLLQLVHSSGGQTSQLLELWSESWFPIGVVRPTQLRIATSVEGSEVWTDWVQLTCTLSLHDTISWDLISTVSIGNQVELLVLWDVVFGSNSLDVNFYRWQIRSWFKIFSDSFYAKLLDWNWIYYILD